MTTRETQDIPNYVQLAHESDKELVNHWHIFAGLGLNKCIEKTIEDLASMDGLKFYVVENGVDFVGYFASQYDGEYQPTIFIHPKYRDQKMEFWKEIEKQMKPEWKAGIYSKNIRCSKFYSKMGKRIYQIITPMGFADIFEFKRTGDLCH